MKQLVILSGKGGTGKTSLAAAFAHLARDGPVSLRAVLADADVDAANLELVLQPHMLEQHEFMGGSKAIMDSAKCEGCGVCAQVCRFDAVISSSGLGRGYRRETPVEWPAMAAPPACISAPRKRSTWSRS